MKSPELGTDPADYLSQATQEKDTKLTKIFEIPIRRNPEKPGRELTVVWDERLPLIEGFENKYSYVVNFSEKGNHAGNHYHHHKEELFTPIVGKFTIILEDIETKEREEVKLERGQFIYIPPKTAHTVVSETEIASLYVSATYPNNEQDEFEYSLQ